MGMACKQYAIMQLRNSIHFSIFIKRMFSVNLQEAQFEKFKHPFRSILTRKEVIQHLTSNLIYEDEKIVAFNKPAGIGKSRPSEEIGGSGEAVYLDELIGRLPNFTEHPNPKIVKFPEKYSSGVTIITKNDDASQEIAKCKLRTKGGDYSDDSFLVISLGCPTVEKNACKLAVKLEGNNSKRKIPILTEEWSQREMKMQKVKVIRFKHEVLSISTLASLVRVKLSATKSNALRLYLATKLLSPILGDSIFSGRVKNIMGVPMLIDPWSDVANHPQKLPKDVTSALLLPPNKWNLVPFCAHLEEVSLPRYRGNKDLILKAPLPPTFAWVCQQLGLQTEELL